MKKHLILLSVFLFLLSVKSFSQTVYVNQTGNTYHTNKCKLYTKNFEAIPLWKAKGAYGKTPCNKCKPPTKERKAVAKKKSAAKPKSKTAAPVKK
ncbi:MAG: hypothetical protein EPN85_01100 [Bacteroidetes bacterium]|nr:MAG: hypothetical protein EPN85_01100 [Bacteroidota bacterium]